MWTSDQLGLAHWNVGDSSWSIDARGGEYGIGVLSNDSERRYMSLSPVNQDQLPAAGEQYIRGDQLHINYPQGAGHYAIRLVWQPIETSADLLVLEITISIQTDLLDSHPKIDIDVDCQSIDSIVPSDVSGDDEVEGVGSAPISVASSSGHCCAVLLGPHDRPFTTNHSNDMLLRLRLFGEFLEKGVIRRGRPWIVIGRSGKEPSPELLTSLLTRLAESPVPLT